MFIVLLSVFAGLAGAWQVTEGGKSCPITLLNNGTDNLQQDSIVINIKCLQKDWIEHGYGPPHIDSCIQLRGSLFECENATECDNSVRFSSLKMKCGGNDFEFDLSVWLCGWEIPCYSWNVTFQNWNQLLQFINVSDQSMADLIDKGPYQLVPWWENRNTYLNTVFISFGTAGSTEASALLVLCICVLLVFVQK